MLRTILLALTLANSPCAGSTEENEAKILESLKEAGAEVERDKKTRDVTLVAFENRNISQETLKRIAKVESVESIYFTNCNIPDSGLNPLWQMPKLRTLYFMGPIKAKHLEGIEAAKSLKLFGAGGNPVDVSVIKALARSKSLRALSFEDAELTDDAIKVFTEIPQLNAFLVKGKHKITDASISHLNNMKKLLKKVSPDDVKYGLNFEFAIEPCRFTDKGLQQLKHHEKYSYFLIPSAPITDASLPVLKKFVNCRGFDLRGTKLTKGAVKELADTFYLSEIESDYQIDN